MQELPPPRVLPRNREPRVVDDPRRWRRRAATATGIVALIVAVGIGGYALGNRGAEERGAEPDGQTAASPATATPATTPRPAQPTPAGGSIPVTRPVPSPTVGPTSTPRPTATPEGPVPADPDADPGPDAPPDVAEVAELIAAGEVPESRGIVKGGRIYLVGAVPTAADATAIADLAAEVLGAANVYNGYVIDPRAGDPSEGQVRVDDTVLFATGSAEISPEFEPLLNQGLALLTLRPDVTFTIAGHTDDVGDDATNQQLSEQRAEAVVAWYTERGVDPDRLTAVGFGETQPLVPNDTEAQRERNRRIEVVIENLLGGN